MPADRISQKVLAVAPGAGLGRRRTRRLRVEHVRVEIAGGVRAAGVVQRLSLARAHAALDRAVWAAYGWNDPDPATTADETILARLLALNGERANSGNRPVP